MFAYLFIPKNYAPPYQTIILFPGASAFSLRSTSEGNKLHSWDAVDFVIKSGRAVLYPIYKSYHERGDGFSIYNPDMSMSSLRDHFIMWRKDLGRSIDYLESRSDIDHDKIGFFGSSFGSVIGIGLLAIEKRLKIGTLRLVGFAYGYRLHPEIAPIDYASRIKIPILVLNGKYDMIFPYKSSQLPMFRSLGTPKEHKRLVLFDVGHTSPRPRAKAIKEVLDWLDHYFGPVKRK